MEKVLVDTLTAAVVSSGTVMMDNMADSLTMMIVWFVSAGKIRVNI